MSFTPKTAPYSGRVNAVTLGTGDNAIVIGGQNVLPFYTFDAPIENAPKVGVEVSDLAASWDWAGLKEFYAGCTTMADYAKKAESIEGCDFIALNFVGADPNGANRSVADCVPDAKAVAEVVTKPIVVMGCKNLERDGELLAALAEALAGKNVLFMSAKNENYKTVGASVVMDIGTAAVGYGYEYAASTFDRIRLAALAQGDNDLQMPILAVVCNDTWGVKESTASEADEPNWGCMEERAISMEVATAAADLTGGADAVVLRHPESVATIKKFITELI